MGIYYGGAAFENGQVQAQANTMVQNATQIAAAFQEWSLNNGGDTGSLFVSANNGVLAQGYSNSLLTGKYLAEIPALPFQSPIVGVATFDGTWQIAAADGT